MSTTVQYKGATLATVNNDTKILTTAGTYLEDDITLTDVTSSASDVTVGTATSTNDDATAVRLDFTNIPKRPKAFFVRLTTTLSRSSSYRHYYVAAVRYNGTDTKGCRWYRYNGQYAACSGLSFMYGDNTLSIYSTGSQSSSPGAFYNGTYELTYVY